MGICHTKIFKFNIRFSLLGLTEIFFLANFFHTFPYFFGILFGEITQLNT